MQDSIKQYLKGIEQTLKAGTATEHTYRPALKTLLESLAQGVIATNEPRRIECGAPDFVVSRDGLIVGYVEAKDVGKSLDEAERSEQVQRYRRSLGNLILTDYLEFRWYVDGELRRAVHTGASGRSPLPRDKDYQQAALDLLQDFLAHVPQPIATPQELAQRLARLTHLIRDIIVEAFERDRASNLLLDLRQACAVALIPDLDQPQKVGEFADMYAQTIAYGLFAACCNHRGPGPFRRLGAAAEIPKTNPFLRNLFETITGTALDDEPYAGLVDDLVQLLANADMEAILAHFGQRTRQEDPVVHFYETFLATYDPRLRERRGVYYTPEPVIAYIVHSVDHLLRTRFDLPLGLADAATVQYERDEDGQQPRRVKATASRVLILDPATGTSTFLYAVVDHIREQFMRQGNAGMWSGYVRGHLLPRLFGFELLMAPYAVAHLKLGLQLAGMDLSPAQRKLWAYDFAGDERLNIYLTNTLEEAERRVETLFGPLRVISQEANAAAHVKRDLPIMVILGNPPYSGHSANRSWEIRDGKRVPTFIGRLVQDYYTVDGQPLGERNPKWLQDDYVKFIRWGQWRIERTGAGILAFITNHGYLDNPTFRGMRQHLMQAFTDIYILDLHGNTKKKERAPDGSPDENVFDIQQGVAIGIFVKEPGKSGPATVHHAELWGLREHKYRRLFEQDVAITSWQPLQPTSPFYLFTPQDAGLRAEYERGWKITDIMPVNVLGFQTHRDAFAIDFDRASLHQRIKEMRDRGLSDEAFREKYGLQDSGNWQLADARARLRENDAWENALVECLYRPFDWRFCYYSEAVMDRPRRELLDHVAGRDNLCLLSSRQQATIGYKHAWVAKAPANDCVVSTTSREANQVFPLYLYDHQKKEKPLRGGGSAVILTLFETQPGYAVRRPNLNTQFVAEMEGRLGLRFQPDLSGLEDLTGLFGPEDVFHYIYAVLHSPTYRARYAGFLKMDFPRLPLTSDRDLFRRLCELGAELAALHLLGSPAVSRSRFITRYPVPGDNRVAKGHPHYLAAGEPEPGSERPLPQGRVYINPAQYFEGVPAEVWGFQVGGYQVCDKWLKDRRGRQLTYDDLTHYQEMVVALKETIRVMEDIDHAIPGWPVE